MRALLVAVPLLLAGCEYLDPYLPTVAFERLDLNEIDWTFVDTDFVFKVDNPNPIEVPLASFDYALRFAGVEIISGADPDGLVLLASEQSELALPVELVFQSLYDLLEATRGEDEFPFALSGHFGFDTPMGFVEIPYDAEGMFPALRTPVTDLGQLRVDKLSWSQIDLAIDLDIDNDHRSTLWFSNFDYDITVAGARVASGVTDLGGIEGAQTDTATLPISISNVDAIAALYDVLSGSDRVRVALEAETDVETPFGGLTLDIDESGNVEIRR